jgi:hypothetical protein
LLVDLDDKSVATARVDPLPTFAEQLMCRAAGVHKATAPRIVARRIMTQIDAEPPDPASFAAALFGSRTVSDIVDAMPAPNLPALFADGGQRAVTSPALQNIKEFPIRRKRRCNRSLAASENDSTSSSPPMADPSAGECATYGPQINKLVSLVICTLPKINGRHGISSAHITYVPSP